MDAVFKKTLSALGSPEFAQAFANEVRELANVLPLEKICKRGGWPNVDGPFHLFDITVAENGDDVSISCAVSFEEALPACCAGGVATETATGRLSGVINRATGKGAFTAEGL